MTDGPRSTEAAPRSPSITIPPAGTEPHPTKVAVFSTEDIPHRKPIVGQLLDLAGIPAIVAVDGVPMRMQVSEFVQKGWVLIFDTAHLDTPTPVVLDGDDR